MRGPGFGCGWQLRRGPRVYRAPAWRSARRSGGAARRGAAAVAARAQNRLTVRMGWRGRYLAMSRAVRPVTVITTISAAFSLVAARTAAVASASV